MKKIKGAKWYGRLLLPVWFMWSALVSFVSPMMAIRMTIDMGNRFAKSWGEK